MNRKGLKYFSFCLAIFLIGFIQKAFEQVPIKYLGINQGLSNNSVRCVYQDRQGFIWLGTYYGLDRYDGSEFKVFTNKLSDSTSLPHNYIYQIHEDKFNNFWVSTGQALAIYKSVTNEFSAVSYFPVNSTKSEKVNVGLTAINSDNNGNVFLGSDELGLLVKKPDEKNARQVFFTVKGENTSRYRVRSIIVSNDKVWLFVPGWGLCIYNNSSGKIETVNSELSNADCMLEDRAGNLWIGAETGLYKYSIAENKYTESYKEGPQGLTYGAITSLCLDKNGKIWIGKDGTGVNIFDPAAKTFSYIQPGEGKNKLSSESVNSIIADKESRIWIGTLRGGCDVIDEEKNRFSTISRTPFSEYSLPSNFIYSFCEDKDHDILIGTDGGGMSVWNRATNTFHNFKHITGDPSSLSNNSVASIKQDSYGNIWVGTFGGGINKFNKTNGTFEHFACINDVTKVENKVAWLLYEDKQKEVWASTFGDGKLYKFNREHNRFGVFSQDLNNLVSLAEDSRGNLWGGTSTQLIQIDRANLQHHYIEIGRPVRAIYEDKHHNFWLGTEGEGLILFDAEKRKIIHRYSETDGLCNNAVLNILEDSTGNLWLSTFNGLAEFDPVKKTFTNFYQSDGLQSNQFSYRAALVLKTGEMVFGGINGFNIFFPEKISVRNYMPPVYITDISVNSKNIFQSSGYITKTDNGGIAELKVPYNQAVLSFRFNALEYSSPDKILYAYYLEGWDKGWNYSGNIRNINYNNIREGKYTLHVKNTNINGTWNPVETKLAIIILPPWYRSWWAYTIYLLIATGLFYLTRRYRLQRAKLKYEVELAHIEAEKEKEISEKRQSFFTNITHEFRTPLTLIINPVKDLLHKENNNPERSELNFVYRNARRLLSLVDQLLLFRKTESETGQLTISKFNFCQLCHETYLYFAQQAKAKNIEYEFDCPNHELEIYADKGKLEIIFFNLLSNALKFTPDKGKINFRITETADNIEAEVTDSGTGIPTGVGDRLFEKFYQVDEKSRTQKPGFGIGLFLVKQFVDQHGGTIRYVSKEGNGTSFYISLKKGKTHFNITQVREEAGTDNVLVDEIIAGAESIEDESKSKTNGLESIISEKQSILVTDDNEQMRNYLAQIFKANFIVHEAGNGEDGLRIAKEYQPDMIISDVVMGDMTGIDFCKAVKESPTLNHIPFILITGGSSPESRLKGIETGADDYITKPFEKEVLVARVQSLIKKQENLQKYFYNEITHQHNTLNISTEYKEFLDACIAVVENNIDNEEFNIQTLATEIGMSHSKLYKKIKTISGQSANAFIRFIRLRKAAEMFINTNYNINETAFYVGIKDMKYFREQFTKTFGLKPSEYIEKYRKPFAKNYKLNEKIKKDND